MYINQNTMGYPNQVQNPNPMAENLLFQNQSSATIADIVNLLDKNI